jgi:metallo-beta-lactamase family protein
VFSGDVGQDDSPILRDPQTDPGVPVDIALMESTYGDRRHRERVHRDDPGSPADVRG